MYEARHRQVYVCMYVYLCDMVWLGGMVDEEIYKGIGLTGVDRAFSNADFWNYQFIIAPTPTDY